MLKYFNYGLRNFIKDPVQPFARFNWEFFAVIKGSCRPLLENDKGSSLCGSTLWLFPPGKVHGWTGSNRACFRAVFNFAVIPQIVSENLPSKKFYEVRLTSEERNSLLELAKEIHPHFLQPDATYELRINYLLYKLCLIVLQKNSFEHTTPLARIPQLRVYKAEAFYRSNLPRLTTVDEVAASTGVSANQLRRAFLGVKGTTPQLAFREIRLQRACHMMAETDLTLDIIAQKNGFKSSVDFHRTFKAKFRTTPHAWRSRNCTILPQ